MVNGSVNGDLTLPPQKSRAHVDCGDKSDFVTLAHLPADIYVRILRFRLCFAKPSAHLAWCINSHEWKAPDFSKKFGAKKFRTFHRTFLVLIVKFGSVLFCTGLFTGLFTILCKNIVVGVAKKSGTFHQTFHYLRNYICWLWGLFYAIN